MPPLFRISVGEPPDVLTETGWLKSTSSVTDVPGPALPNCDGNTLVTKAAPTCTFVAVPMAAETLALKPPDSMVVALPRSTANTVRFGVCSPPETT